MVKSVVVLTIRLDDDVTVKKPKNSRMDSAERRRRAEEKLKQRGAGSRAGEVAPERLIHELEVHQIELEMQNEELLAARQETEASLARYTELFDFAPIGYAILDPDETIREINYAGAGLLGKVRSHIVGTRFAMHMAMADRGAFARLLWRALAGPTKESCEAELTGDGRGTLFVRISANVLTLAEKLILVAFEDISERRLAEQRLARSDAALREAHRHKDELLATLSHELRTPLAPIRTSLFILDRVEASSERGRKAHAIIDRQVTHLTRRIDDLLDVARIAQGTIKLVRQNVEAGELVRRTVEDHRGAFEAGGMILEAAIEPGPFWIDADPRRVTQIVGNLLGNSEKFMDRGGRASVRVRREGQEVCIEVRDDGPGIAPEVLDRRFEPFVQGPKTLDRARGGLGLGLAMVKGLAELHGGTVALASPRERRGTEITVSLPLVEPPAALGAVAPDVAKHRSRRVLIIEDDVDTAESIRDGLALLGHDVQIAHDGPHGLALAHMFAPDIVICDLNLPRIDGYQVARTLRSFEGPGRVFMVALSGYTVPEELHHAECAGFDRLVAGPATLEELDRLIAEAPLLEDLAKSAM